MDFISFGSTFKIDGMQDYYAKNAQKIEQFCEENHLQYASEIEVKAPAKNAFDVPKYSIKTRIIAPDEKDGLVEAFLANKGIKFEKLSTEDLLNKSKILTRIEEAPKNMSLVRVNAEKFNNLLSNQSNNTEHCEKDYNEYYKDNIDLMIKSGDKIPATTLYIIPSGESVENTLDYIDKYGAERLNKDQLTIAFSQTTDKPDHCMFFGMKDLGMKEIPVYVNNDTYKIGNALGIFE